MNIRLFVSTLVAAAMALASDAGASRIAQSAFAFHAFKDSDAPYVVYNHGTAYAGNQNVSVVASADRDPFVAGVTVTIDGYGPGIAASVYSVDYQGNLLTFASYGASPAGGAWELNHVFSAAEAPRWSYASVYCSLTSNANSFLTGLTTFD